MGEDENPAKHEINAIFKRLRGITSNKICFDCGTNNPTWSSVTYGVFICIDCSATHRGLGVHLSFVRSTQLDTNWTWLQLRAMQLGGNANATQFFAQHGCHSTDAQQKYKSRAAQLYREKLHHLAVQAQRLHGTKLHIESAAHDSASSPSPRTKDVDFFEEHSSASAASALNPSSSASNLAGGLFANANVKQGDERGPSVEALSGGQTGQDLSDAKRSAVIGQRRAPAKKGPVKKGLGAQKVTANFGEIEKNAEILDKEREEAQKNGVLPPASDSASDVPRISDRFAVQDVSKEREKKEEQLKHSDPKKVEQVERLGMGLGGSKGGVSHSVFDDMRSIKQEGSRSNRRTVNEPTRLQDDWEIITTSSVNRRDNDDLFPDRKDDEDDFFDAVDDVKPKVTSKQPTYVASSAASDDAQKKFGSAKAISSDQYFGAGGSDFETRTTLNRFEGSTAISSADYFGDGDDKSKLGNKPQGGGYASYGTYANAMPDMGEIKDSVKVGVSKVAGRLSQLSSSVQTYISDNYGQ